MSQHLNLCEEESLLAELGRARNTDKWYFLLDDAEDGEGSDFLVIHRRHWHLHHRPDDTHVGHLVVVPSGFSETMESTFEYRGETQEGKSLLKSYGISEIETPFMWGDALIVYVPIQGAGWPRLDITCDTPEIKAQTEEWVRDSLPARSVSLPPDWGRTNYMAKIEEHARSKDLVAIVTSNMKGSGKEWRGVSVSLLSRQVANSLPLQYRE